MASSFFKYNSNGFWIQDSIFMISLSYLNKTLKDCDKLPEWLGKMKNLVEENSLGYYHSYMHLEFEEYLINESRKEKFINIIRETQRYLINKGEFIGVDELNSLGLESDFVSRWDEGIETNRIINVFSWMINLIKGRIKIISTDRINYLF